MKPSSKKLSLIGIFALVVMAFFVWSSVKPEPQTPNPGIADDWMSNPDDFETLEHLATCGNLTKNHDFSLLLVRVNRTTSASANGLAFIADHLLPASFVSALMPSQGQFQVIQTLGGKPITGVISAPNAGTNWTMTRPDRLKLGSYWIIAINQHKNIEYNEFNQPVSDPNSPLIPAVHCALVLFQKDRVSRLHAAQEILLNDANPDLIRYAAAINLLKQDEEGEPAETRQVDQLFVHTSINALSDAAMPRRVQSQLFGQMFGYYQQRFSMDLTVNSADTHVLYYLLEVVKKSHDPEKLKNVIGFLLGFVETQMRFGIYPRQILQVIDEREALDHAQRLSSSAAINTRNRLIADHLDHLSDFNGKSVTILTVPSLPKDDLMRKLLIAAGK